MDRKGEDKVKNFKKTWLPAAAMALLALAGRAQAAGVGNPSYLNIDVTISASKSVSVTGQRTSSQSVTFDGSTFLLVSAATASVKNDSGVLSEGWQLSTTANSIDATTSGAGWTIASSSSNLATDNVAVQAVFGSSNTVLAGCPASGATDWQNGAIAPPLTTSAQQYGTASRYVSSTLTNNGSASPDSGTTLFAGSQRALCWRLAMPQTTTLTTADVQIVPIIVTAN
jgi:hypothetical protein